MKNILKKYLESIYEKKYLLFLIMFYAVFHFLCTPDYWDDASYSRLLDTVNNNVFEYLQRMYRMQTSRMGIEFVSAFVCMAPHIVWRILDLLVIILLYYDIEYFFGNILRYRVEQFRWILSLLLCAYPFSTMACTGWKVTTMNYLWVVSAGLYAMNKILKVVLENRSLSLAESFLLILAICYSTSFETLAVLFIVGIAGAIIYLKCIKRAGSPWFFNLSLCIVTGQILLIIFCPGNANRLADDIMAWMPEFEQLNLLDKIRMGVVAAFMHFVSIPSPIFFLFNLMCLWGLWLRKRQIPKKIIAFLPLVIDLMWTGFYLVNYLAGSKAMTYQVPESLLTGGQDTFEQVGLLISILIWFISVFYALYHIFENKRSFYICILVLVIGCVPELVVGMSPTVVNSMLRTVIYLYIAMIILILGVLGELAPYWVNGRLVRRCTYTILAGGTLINALQMVRHIWIYG